MSPSLRTLESAMHLASSEGRDLEEAPRVTGRYCIWPSADDIGSLLALVWRSDGLHQTPKLA